MKSQPPNSKTFFTTEAQRSQRVEKWNAGMMEGWNTGKTSETGSY
jgi:hypothetical protein